MLFNDLFEESLDLFKLDVIFDWTCFFGVYKKVDCLKFNDFLKYNYLYPEVMFESIGKVAS
jgi:hypothetical protein